MTREERMQAFAMRLDGCGWAQIGQALGYEPESVAVDLKRCIQRGPRTPRIVYPAIAEYITKQCGGSVYRFACLCGLSPSALYAPLGGRRHMTKDVADAIIAATGLSRKAAFKKEDRP